MTGKFLILIRVITKLFKLRIVLSLIWVLPIQKYPWIIISKLKAIQNFLWIHIRIKSFKPEFKNRKIYDITYSAFDLFYWT